MMPNLNSRQLRLVFVTALLFLFANHSGAATTDEEILSPAPAEVEPIPAPTLGTYSIELDSTAIAGERVNLFIEYQVDQDINPGGGLSLVPHWQHPLFIQADDPSAENYIAVTTSNAEVQLNLSFQERTGKHGGLEAALEAPHSDRSLPGAP